MASDTHWVRIALACVFVALACILSSACGEAESSGALSSADTGRLPPGSGGLKCATRFSARPANINRASSDILAPRYELLGALLCRYSGEIVGAQNDERGILVGERLLGVAPARGLAVAFDGAPDIESTGGHCNIDSGARMYVLFLYKSSPRVPVSIKLSGCTSLWNERSSRVLYLSPQLLRRLVRMTP